jgi:hypothetical protein
MTEKDKKVLENVFLANRPISCKKCNGKLFYMGSGKYRCHPCDEEYYDDFGKVKEFLEERGSAPAVQIAQYTGVRMELIDLFLRTGKLEIIEDSKFYISCEKGGCAIRYGRYCPHCSREVFGGIMAMFHEDAGECPKKNSKKNVPKVHFFKKN